MEKVDLKQDNDHGLLNTIFANMPEGVFIFWKNKNSVYLGCNNHFAQLLGLSSPQEIIGKTDLDLGWLPDGDSFELFRQGDLETMSGKFICNQKEWLSVYNKKILVLVNKSPLYNEQHELFGVLGVATNITERHQRDEALIKHKLEGMALVAASIAHELRTPLQSIGFGISNLRHYLPSLFEGYRLATQAGLINHTLKNATLNLLTDTLDVLERETRQSSLAIDLLLENLRQSVSSTQQLPIKTVSMAHCVNEALARYPFKPGQRAFLHWDNSNDFMINGNELLVIHIIFNFIKNALHHIAEARKGEMYIWLESDQHQHVLCYKDTGTGIEPEVMPHIFTQFYSKTHCGAGIGLTYCKMAMESLGGKISCESVLGEFTLFKLLFPR